MVTNEKEKGRKILKSDERETIFGRRSKLVARLLAHGLGFSSVGLLCTARPNNSLTHWVSATVVRPRGKVGRPPMRHRLLEASIIRQYSSADCVLGDSHSQIDSALLSGNRGERERRKKKRLNVSFGDFSLLSRGKSVVVGRKQKE